jgi:hypothetical protein
MEVTARMRQLDFQIFYQNFQELFPGGYCISSTPRFTMHFTKRAIGPQPAWAGIITDGSVAGFVPDISYNRTGRRQSLAQVFNMG